MTTALTYYRPVWTCGRYHEEAQVALFYNLIAGVSYFFESHSARVIGRVLAAPRNGAFCLTDLSQELNISMESLTPFFAQLEQLGIVSSVCPSPDVVADYRRRVSADHRRQQARERATQEKLPYTLSNAEQLYTDRTGGITSVMLELTYNCSERCIHCYNAGATRNDDEQSRRGDRQELNLDDYRHLIDDLLAQGLVKVCLSGGDPFSHPHAWDIIDYLYDKDIAFDVFTNGQRLVGREERLAERYPRLVGVSIYSTDADVHDRITRLPGSWQRSLAVVRRLSELAVPMNLKCCVMRPNVKTYAGVADLAQQYGAQVQVEVSLTDSVDGDRCVSRHLRMTPKQLEVVLRDDNVPLYVGPEAPNFGGQLRDMTQPPCGAGEHSLCFTPEGNAIPCCAFHTSFGNVRRQPLSDILGSPERAYWLGLTLNDYEDCGRHDYCAYCNLCPGNNFTEHGTPLKAAEVNCHMARSRYELAQKMQQGYDPLNGKSLSERLSELPDDVPEELKREQSQDFCDKRLTVGG